MSCLPFVDTYTMKFIIFFVTLPCVIYSLEAVGWENQNVKINCDYDEIIVIDSATWKYDPTAVTNYAGIMNWRNFLAPLTYVGVLCSYDKTSVVQNLCKSKQSCSFVASRKNIGDECNYWMKLNIDYHCHKCQHENRLRRYLDNQILAAMCLQRSVEQLRAPGSRTNDHIGDGNVHCPNHEFLDKHVNTVFPNTEYGARQFAERVHRMRSSAVTSQTNTNTVFNAPLMSYNERESQYCVFYRTAPKYNCVLNNNAWTCTYEGDVIAAHNKNNGHYHPELDHYYATHDHLLD